MIFNFIASLKLLSIAAEKKRDLRSSNARWTIIVLASTTRSVKVESHVSRSNGGDLGGQALPVNVLDMQPMS